MAMTKNLSRESVNRLYWAEGLSSFHIARQFGVSQHCVMNNMRRLHIPCRPPPTTRSLHHIQKATTDVSGLTEGEKGWFAGFIDGEGTLSIKRNNHGDYFASISVCNTNREVIEFIAQLFRCALHTRAAYENRKLIYRVATSHHRNILAILEAAGPYLKVKKRHAEVIIAFCREVEHQYLGENFDWGACAPYVEQIRRLNKRGRA